MMKRFLIFVWLLFNGVLLFAASKYPVSEIPEALMKDVNVVVREDHMVYKIFARNRATLNVRMVATIFNKSGSHYASPTVGYDKLSKVTSFTGSVFDAKGTLIRKLKNSEIQDHSAFDGFSLYSDNRYKAADLSHGQYPFTVEYEYEVEYKFLYAIQGTNLVSAEKISVQKLSYQLIYKPELAPRYKLINLDQQPVQEKTKDGMESLSWTFENILPIKLEPLGPFIHEQVPRILAAPGQFEYEGYAGDMSTWESYGVWEASLNKGRDALPPETKQKVMQLTKDLPTLELKAKAIYEYLQNKTRYVSISLGIGGLQPFEASVVDKVGYGDCKALSNYMVALLQAVDIKGYYTTVKAGNFREDLMLDFPSHQGNHVIVAIPNAADTIWLECTSQTTPFGYSGMSTGNRKAFMLTENGGVWVNTPRYTHEDNLQIRTADVTIEPGGDASAKVRTTYTGLQYENDNLDGVLTSSAEDQKKWILKTTQIPSFDVQSFTMTNRKSKMPSAVVDMHLSLKRFSTISGKRLFISPNLMNRSTFIPEKIDNRKTNVFRRMGYTDMDTIRYRMPDGIYPEFLPEPVSIKSRFGEYESSITIIEGDVLYIRKVKVYKGEYPPESYGELVEFYKGINKSDNVKLVFLTKT